MHNSSSDGETVSPDLTGQQLGLNELVDNVIASKGYMIRKFKGCINISDWTRGNWVEEVIPDGYIHRIHQNNSVYQSRTEATF